MTAHLPGTRALKTLEAAGRHLNFSRAAAELGLTPAAVSHQVKEFEQQLGVRLFHRTSRAATLTPAGEIMYAAISDALDSLTRARANAQRTRQARRLQISAAETIATRWLMARIDSFMHLYPDIDIGLDITSRDIPDFVRDNVDVALCWSDGEHAGMRTDHLFKHILFPVCSPRLIERIGMPRTPRDLLDHRLIHVVWSGKGIIWPDWAAWLKAAGVDQVDQRRGLSFAHTRHALQAAIDGQGIALGDACMIAGDLADGRLVRLFDLAIEGPPGHSHYIVTPIQTVDDELVRTFREWVLREARETMAALSAKEAMTES